MRKSKLTPEREQIILEEMESGSTQEMAAIFAGITEQTLYNWLKRGKEEEPPDDLDDLPKKELIERARGHGIKRINKMNKDQLIHAIIEAESIYHSFYMKFKRASAAGMKKHLQNLERHALEDWKVSAWILERRDPANFGNRGRLQVDNQHSGTIQTEHKDIQETKIEVIQRLQNDPVLQEHYMAIWEREQLINESD